MVAVIASVVLVARLESPFEPVVWQNVSFPLPHVVLLFARHSTAEKKLSCRNCAACVLSAGVALFSVLLCTAVVLLYAKHNTAVNIPHDCPEQKLLVVIAPHACLLLCRCAIIIDVHTACGVLSK